MPRGTSLIDEATIQGRLWSPAQIPSQTLACWCDPSDLSTISIATGVSQVRDKSGNARHLAGSTTPANRPAYETSAQNGRAVLRFSVSGGFMATSAFSFDHSQVSFFWVGNAESGTGNNYESLYALYGVSPPNSPGLTVWVRRYLTTTQLQVLYPAIIGAVTFSIGNRYIIVSSQLQLNGFHLLFGDDTQIGSASVTSSPGVINTTSFSIGGTNGSFFGTIGEVLLFQAYLDPVARQRNAGYLAWKWGLESNLSASHPFRNQPPLI